MLPNQLRSRACGPCRARRGFTLIELIVSLAVITVATTIFIQLYLASTDLGYRAQHRELAATIAESQVAQVVNDPGGFIWEVANPDEQGYFRIRRSADDPRAGVQATLPDVLLPYELSYNQQKAVFERFRWTAIGRLPNPDSAYIEIAVNVQWMQKGDVENVALTSAVHRSKVDPDWAEQ